MMREVEDEDCDAADDGNDNADDDSDDDNADDANDDADPPPSLLLLQRGRGWTILSAGQNYLFKIILIQIIFIKMILVIIIWSGLYLHHWKR